jgi:hypothetical protein
LTWKKINQNHKGRSDIFGGDDIDKISSMFGGTADVDTLDINSPTVIRDDKLLFRNPANTFAYSISSNAIAADRNISLPVMTTNQTFLMANEIQAVNNKTLVNCSFDSLEAPISRFGGDPILRRWGAIFPKNQAASLSGVASFEGIMSSHTLRNPNATPECDYMFPGDWYGYNGQFIRLENTSTDGDWCGIVSPSSGQGICRMSHGGRIRLRWNQEDSNFASFWCGLSSNAAAAPLDDANPLGNSDSGLLIGNNTQTGVFGEVVVYHNGDGTAPHQTTIVSGSDLQMDAQVFNDLDIRWWNDSTGLHATAAVKSAIPSGSLFTAELVPVDLPAANTNLFFHCHLINTGADSQALGIAGMWMESL